VISQRDIVLLTFPFSNLQSSKVRPAIVLSNDRYNRRSEDFVAAPLTSNLKLRDYAILVSNNELESGNLNRQQQSEGGQGLQREPTTRQDEDRTNQG
jgi:mRNA interferase MazF